MKKEMLKKICAVATIGIMSLGLAGCGSDKDDKLSQIKESGKLVVGLSADYAPYEFHIINDKGEDEIVGFDVDIVKEIAKDLGVELEIKDMDFDSLIAGIPGGKLDMAIAGMVPTEERKKVVDFSDAYYTGKQGFLVKAEDKDTYKNFADLKGQKVGAQLGAVQVDVAKENIEGADIQSVSNINDLVLALKSGKIEALVAAIPVAEKIVQSNPELVIGEETVELSDNGVAIAIQKDQKELLDAVNKTIKRMKDENLLDQFMIDANELSKKQIAN